MVHIVEWVVQMVIFLLLSAAPKRNLLYKICCASVQHSLSPPESFIVSGLLWISYSERKLYRKYWCKSWGPLKSAAGAETGMTPGSFISMTQCHPCHHRLPRKYSHQHCATGRKYLSSKKIFKRVKVNIYLSSLSSHPCLRYRPIWSLVTSLLCVQAETHRDF